MYLNFFRGFNFTKFDFSNIIMQMKVLAIDLGGTNIKVGVVEGLLRIKHFFKYRIESSDRSGKNIIEKIVKISVPLIKEENINKIGIAVPGFIDFQSHLIVASPNFPDWKNFPMGKEIQRRVKIPVVLENDANAFAMGEGLKGAGKGLDNFVGMTLGTGVGGGIVINKKIWHGSNGSAGEIGHIIVEPDGFRCNCGGRGCLEMYASRQAIARDGKNLLKGKGIISHESDIPFEIFKLAQRGNKEAIKIFSTVGYYLGIAIADLANILNIDGVILGGGLSNAWEFIYPAIKKELFRANPLARRHLKILKARLGDKAALIGMAKVASDLESNR